MHLTNVDFVLWLVGFIGEALCLSILTLRSAYRSFPVFYIWIASNVFLDSTLYWLAQHAAQLTYSRVYFAIDLPQSLLEIGIIVEIAVSVLHPVKRALPKQLPVVWLLSLSVVGVLGFFFATRLNASTLAHPRAFQIFDTTMAVVRIVTFLLIAGFSQMLGVGWKNRSLQLASGLGLYAAISLVVSVAQSHLRGGPDYVSQYTALDHLRLASYLCALYYWAYSFSKKEAERKDFMPQMEEFLVSIVKANRSKTPSLRSRFHR